MAISQSRIQGRCFCGDVKYETNSGMLWAAYCHCEDCRRIASADYVSWFGTLRSELNWTGKRKFIQSSEKVVRSFCENCGAPMSFETQVFPEESHLYAATLNDPSIYEPQAHVFWSEKLPWLSISDDLPKHPKGLQHAASNGERLL